MKSHIQVFVDESIRPEPRLTLAGAVVLEVSTDETGNQIQTLLDELRDAAYLEGTRAHSKLMKAGFHATDDGMEIGAAFVRLASTMPGLKVFIETSDSSKRPDLPTEDILLLLELRLAETILRKYSQTKFVTFTFEQHSTLNRYYERIVQTAAIRTNFKGDLDVRIAQKTDPLPLAVIDYAMYYFQRGANETSQEWERHRWAAFRPMISSIRSLEHGILLRRGHADEVD